MSPSELIVVVLVALAAVGYGLREYGLFVATYRNPHPPFPYPPERLWRRLKLSTLLLAEAGLLAATLWATRSGERPLTATVLGVAAVAALVALFVGAVVDLRDTRRQYARLKQQALLDARDTWLATTAAQKASSPSSTLP